MHTMFELISDINNFKISASISTVKIPKILDFLDVSMLLPNLNETLNDLDRVH